MRLIVASLAALALASCAAGSKPAPSSAVIDGSVQTNGGYNYPEVASLADGVWMKGDLHIHSRHSKDSSNNPVSKIVGLADKAGMDYLLISDHDNHVQGDTAHHTWADPEYKSDRT